jgi:hypothetical protein
MNLRLTLWMILCRALEMRRRSVTLGPLNVTSATQTGLRGHQLGYRPKTNSDDGWAAAMGEQYIRDLGGFYDDLGQPGARVKQVAEVWLMEKGRSTQ